MLPIARDACPMVLRWKYPCTSSPNHIVDIFLMSLIFRDIWDRSLARDELLTELIQSDLEVIKYDRVGETFKDEVELPPRVEPAKSQSVLG